MKHGPWTSGPRELLDHANIHLLRGTDFDCRVAMISVDNAVELILTTFLTLPKSFTDLDLTPQQRRKYTRSFPIALRSIEQLVPERVALVPLDDIEYFHRLRNRLYHEGDGITLSPLTGEIVAQLISTGKSSFSLEPLRPERFAEQKH